MTSATFKQKGIELTRAMRRHQSVFRPCAQLRPMNVDQLHTQAPITADNNCREFRYRRGLERK